MIYEHVCQMEGCAEIVERNRKTGYYTCFKCKEKRIKLNNILSYARKNTPYRGDSSI